MRLIYTMAFSWALIAVFLAFFVPSMKTFTVDYNTRYNAIERQLSK